MQGSYDGNDIIAAGVIVCLVRAAIVTDSSNMTDCDQLHS